MSNTDVIELFGDYTLTAAEARAAIRAYAHSGTIREWRCLRPTPPRTTSSSGEPSPQHDVCYAGVATAPDTRHPAGHALGHGDTPRTAIEDLLWRLVGPRLLADDNL